MNEAEKKAYLEKYHQEKEKGVPFYPDIIFKDAVVTLLIFLILAALSYFVGVQMEERANPADANYNPRPEWYFLFLFQLLKYFPGELEVVGVVLLPTLAIVALFLLPFLDHSAKRHFLNRPVINGLVLLSIVGILFLTFQSIREIPPPVDANSGDKVAALYIKNCSNCHGASIQVAPGTNLHEIIASGKHEAMPAWSADLTADQIDALAGFILSPGGSELFTANCGSCHDVSEVVASSPIDLKDALEKGTEFAAHKDQEISDWANTLEPEEKTILLNFLVAPDGQRIFTVDCSPCHGAATAFSGEREQLLQIISQGGMHLDMPPWQEKLSQDELNLLAKYVIDPSTAPEADKLFKDNCSACHGERVPKAADFDQAYQMIASGGAHQSMPIWGQVLTDEQLNALVDYTLEAAQGSATEVGQQLFGQNCVACHGEFGEGGPNPSRAGDVIAPISSAEYLKTRDDFTLGAIISQGQPNWGMSAFGSEFGGPLNEDEIADIVSYMRTWETNPPVELPAEVAAETLPLEGADIYKEICAQCHGARGEGIVAPALADPKLQAAKNDQELFDSISLGHENTSMIAWGTLLSDEQIVELVNFIRQLEPIEQGATPQAAAFKAVVLPIFKDKCAVCHGSMGGWDSSSYEKVMTSGDNAPVIIPGDADGSLLVQKLLDQQTEGMMMPPSEKLSDVDIQAIIDWINAGALDN